MPAATDSSLGLSFLQLQESMSAIDPRYDLVHSLSTPWGIEIHQDRSVPLHHLDCGLIHFENFAFGIGPAEARQNHLLLLIRIQQLSSGKQVGLLVDVFREIGI